MTNLAGAEPRGVRLRQRALRLICPWCAGGPLFAGWLTMHPRCSGCGLKFEREPGYFLGSIYLNYGLAIVVALGLHLVLESVWHLKLALQVPLLLGAVLLLGLGTFRHARALWLAFDLSCDPPAAEEFRSPV